MKNTILIKQTSLAQDCVRMNVAFTNRASAVFALLIRSKADLGITFLNYWKINHKISQVQFNNRIYYSEGNLAHCSTRLIEDWHNDIVMKSLLEPKDFEDMVECEIISLDNLRYAFPDPAN